MDNINRHRETLKKRYAPGKNSAAIIASSKELIILALKSTHLIDRHRRKMISEALWWITEADGKYSTRFRTKKVVDLAVDKDGNGNGGDIKIQHEHVHPRSEVSKKLLTNPEAYIDNPEALDKVIEQTIGCIVTAEEHRSLKKGKKGWERYEGVTVYDMKEEKPIEFIRPPSLDTLMKPS